MRPSAIAPALIFAAAAAAQQAPPSDPVAAAKRDLAEMKAPAAQQDAASALPSLDMKDLGPLNFSEHSDAPAVLPDKDPSLDPAKRKPGTGNWLVDAMEKRSDRQKDSRSRDKDDASRSDLDLLLGDRTGDGSEKDALSPEEAVAERDGAGEPDTSPSKAYNPLDSFMSGWVSANDRELLVPSKADPSRTDLIPGLGGGPEGSAGDDTPAGAEGAAPLADLAPANPYIGALDAALEPQAKVPALAEPADFESLLEPEVSTGLSAPAAEPPPGAEQRDFIPDFAQPSDDDKYFKQLKRF